MVVLAKDATYLEKVKKDFGRSRTKEFSAHSSKAHCVAWNCTGKYIASGNYVICLDELIVVHFRC